MKSIICVLVLNITVVCTYAQTFEELTKQREEEMKAYQKQEQDGLNHMQADYKKYVSEQDKEFAEYLKKKWKEFQVFSGVEVPESPKPPAPPVFNPNDESSNDENTQLKLNPQDHYTVNENSPNHPTVDNLPDRVSKPSSLKDSKIIGFNFFRADINIETDKKLLLAFNYEISEKGFANYWEVLASSAYGNPISQLIDYSNQLKLNDWAYYMLVEGYANKIHPNDKVSSQLLTWFLLVKSGYKVKIGYSGNQIILMLPALQQIYGVDYITYGKVKYYMTQQINSSVFTYENNFEGANNQFRLDFRDKLNLPVQKGYRKLDFNYENKDYSVDIAYNKNLISFYDEYPFIDLDIYFDAPVSDLTAKSLALEFNQILEGRSTEDKANLLLSFIQKALPYETDGEQFGKEKYFYVEDIFSYSYSDCEDRSVLYSYLVRNLLGLRTIGLNAPGHVFTAVDFDSVLGDYIDFEGERFTVCDPTYIGAKVGKGMPKFMNNNLRVISIK